VRGGAQMRLSRSRRRGSSALAVVGSCLGVYVILAMAFHWFVEPTVAKSREVAAYQPPPPTMMQYSPAPVAVPVTRIEPPSRIAATSATSGPTSAAPEPASAAHEPADKPVETAPKKPPRQHVERTTARHERPAGGGWNTVGSASGW
jgi:hypothetical protein